MSTIAAGPEMDPTSPPQGRDPEVAVLHRVAVVLEEDRTGLVEVGRLAAAGLAGDLEVLVDQHAVVADGQERRDRLGALASKRGARNSMS